MKNYKRITNDKNREIFQPKNFLEKTDIGKESEDYAKELLFLSWTDLISSGILYRRKLYPQAVYMLQQSIEKATKAEYLRDGTLKIDSLKKIIGHKSHLAFNETLLSDFIELAKYNKSTEKNLPKIEKFFREKFQKGQNKEEGNLFLSFVSEEHLKDLINSLGKKHKRRIYSVGGSSTIKEGNSKHIISLKEELWILSQIVSIHESLSRYPNKKLNPSEYNESLPLIKIFPEVHHKMMDVLSVLDIETLKQFLKSNHLDD